LFVIELLAERETALDVEVCTRDLEGVVRKVTAGS
jgi:hypothetical protein